ncbi:MAG: FecR domain-containing protein [Balneolales bacterium]
MSTNQNIPENDPDLMLARQYGKMLSEKDRAGSDDPFLDLLLRARSRAENEETKIPVPNLDASWNRIWQSSNQHEAKWTSNVLSMPSAEKWIWAAAAILLLAFTSIFLMQQFGDPEPRLLAESGSAISVIELTDGSSVTLRPNSKLYERTATENLQHYSLHGEALFEVKQVAGRTFSVESGPGRVTVTGTRFNLSDRNQQAVVHLLEGSVLFEIADGSRSVSLSSGEAAIIDKEFQLREPFTFEPEEITGWTQNRLIFRDRQVADILDELEFHFNISIQAPEEIEQINLGGSIQLESPQQSLQDLGDVLGGEFVKTGDDHYQFRISS